MKSFEQAVYKILWHNSTTIFGGSFALRMCGILNREVSDLDLVFPYCKGSHHRCRIANLDLKLIQGSRQSYDAIGENLYSFFRAEILESIKVDCFFHEEQYDVKVRTLNSLGRKMFLQDPEQIIDFKILWITEEKHRLDLMRIYNRFIKRNRYEGILSDQCAINIYNALHHEVPTPTTELPF